MKVQKSIDLKPFTTFKVGGEAEFFFMGSSQKELVEIIDWANQKNLPINILGGGSNVIISDVGLSGLLLLNKAGKLEIFDDYVRVESGTSLKTLNNELLKKGKGGLEALANIPGTVGGAIVGNVGAYRKFIGDFLKEAKVLYDGKVETVGPEFFEFEYRNSKLKKGFDAVILEVTLSINDIDPKESLNRILEDKKSREMKHPSEPSCGSYFKNPSKEKIAGSLIEGVGLKGYRIGDAMVSEKHANFLINKGNAKAADVKRLADYIKKKVFEETGEKLEEEVKYLGEF